MRRADLIAVSALLLISGTLLVFQIDRVPPNFNQDELGFALNAYSISRHLTDLAGNPLPTYFPHLGFLWATPITVYWGALFFKFFPVSVASVRLASAAVGLLDLGLFYLLAKEIFGSGKLALVGAFLFLTTPAHFINSRIFIDNVFIVPFVILWLWCLVRFVNQDNPKHFLAGMFILGVGFYSYVAAAFLMPFYLLISYLLVRRRLWRRPKWFWAGLLVFALPQVFNLIQLHRFPQTYIQRTNSFDAFENLFKAVLTRPFLVENLVNGFSSYLQFFIAYFNPSFLFWSGDSSLIHSTGGFGVFLITTLPLFLTGLAELLKSRAVKVNRLVILGFFTFPLVGAVIFEPGRISRTLNVIPFYLLICLAGLKVLLEGKKIGPKIGWGLAGLTGSLFLIFLGDYFYRYPARAGSSFRGGLPDAFRAIINLEKSGAYQKLYVDQEIAFADYYFRFFQIERECDECLPPQMVNRQNLPILSGNGLLLTKASEPIPVGQDGNLHWRLIESFPGPSFAEKYFLYGAI